MIVRFYQNKDEPIKAIKKPVLIKEYTGSNMIVTDVVNPVIQVPLSSDLLKCNYCYIAEFNRYYFATSSVINNSIIEFRLHSDVLSNTYDQYKNLDAIVSRQENVFNLYQNDPEISLYCTKNVQFLKSNKSLPLTPSYILITAG